MRTNHLITITIALLGFQAQATQLFQEQDHTKTIVGEGSSGGGNGGGSFVCKDPHSDEIRKAVMQDLWEASRRGAEFKNIKDEVKDAKMAIEIMRTINPFFTDEIQRELNYIIDERSIEMIKIKGESTHDFDASLEADFCKNIDGISMFVNAAIYFDSGEIVYSKRVWDAFDVLNKAALNLHEAIYKTLRIYFHDNNSKRTRFIVGELLSLNPDLKAIAEMIPRSKYTPSPRRRVGDLIGEFYYYYNRSTWRVTDNFETEILRMKTCQWLLARSPETYADPEWKHHLDVEARYGMEYQTKELKDAINKDSYAYYEMDNPLDPFPFGSAIARKLFFGESWLKEVEIYDWDEGLDYFLGDYAWPLNKSPALDVRGRVIDSGEWTISQSFWLRNGSTKRASIKEVYVRKTVDGDLLIKALRYNPITEKIDGELRLVGKKYDDYQQLWICSP